MHNDFGIRKEFCTVHSVYETAVGEGTVKEDENLIAEYIGITWGGDGTEGQMPPNT